MKINAIRDNGLDKRIYFWNAFGGLVSAGIFSLAYANAMLLQNIGTLDSRSHQCANTNSVIKFKDYFTSRLSTSVRMMFLACLIVGINAYSTEKAYATLLVCLFIVLCNISDIFQGNAQVKERLDLGGQSLALRGILNLAVFIISYMYSNNLNISLIFMNISAVLWIVIFDNLVIGRLERPRIGMHILAVKQLLTESQ